ncbi:MAG: LysE family transporter [Nitrososphaerales archaeon]
MELFQLFLVVVFVTLSGALAPGPLFFYTLLEGTKSGTRGGLFISIGHTLFEFPYIMVLALGLQSIFKEPLARQIISFLGGGVLIIFGLIQLYSSLTKRRWESNLREKKILKSSMLMGFLFTGLNPFFLLWWVSVGSKLILDALILASIVGVITMYLFHIWIDYAFLILSAHLAKKGVNILGLKAYPALLISFSLILIFFGLYFILS